MGRFNDLPTEIVFEILTRLPTEAVLECKSVCKPWSDLVHLPSFSQKHLNYLLHSRKSSFIVLSRHPEINAGFYYAEYDENCHETLFSRQTRINLSLPFLKYDYCLVGSCNGLVCFNASIKLGAPYQSHYICNPITREYIMLPISNGYYWWTGFGYVSSTNQYKVVRIYQSRGASYVGIVQVYTLGSVTGWRNAGTTDTSMENFGSRAGAFANGALHWVDFSGTLILAFNLADECCSELPAPPPCLTRDFHSYSNMKLGVLGNFLSAGYYYKTGNCDIWLWKKDDDDIDFRWSKEFSLVTAGVPFEFTKNGKLLYHELNVICSYDPKVSSAKTSASFGKYISKAILHKNTLVSLKALGEQDTKLMEFSLREGSSEVIEISATA